MNTALIFVVLLVVTVVVASQHQSNHYSGAGQNVWISVNPVNDDESRHRISCSDVREEIAGLRAGQEEIKRMLNDIVPETTHISSGHLPHDCSDALLSGKASGVYRIQPHDQGEPIQVVCDMETDGGGWTVFQRRQDGSVEFYLDWVDYRQGFGDLNGEFWLGNDNISRISSQGKYELRVDLTDFEDKSAYATYSTFSVGNESQIYILAASGYNGTAGDSLTRHHDQPFSTRDRDNASTYCAQKYNGAWWYASCHDSNLNGKYLRGDYPNTGEDTPAEGVVWQTWKGYYYSLKTTEMKMRRKI